VVTRAFTALAGAMLGLLLLRRLADGSSTALVQSWYSPVLLAAGLALAALAAFTAAQCIRPGGRWRVRTSPGAAVLALAVFVPVAVGLAVTPRPLGSTSLKDDSGFVGGARLSGASTRPAPEDRNLYQLAYELQSTALATLIGDPVDVIGFVHHGKEPRPGRFYAARFVVACCVADAVGVTVPVAWQGAATLGRDTWVRVVGRIGVDAEGAPIVVAASVEPIGAPANPYIYP
jgi:uncharacterized repeat protein (TIGR03943 family)